MYRVDVEVYVVSGSFRVDTSNTYVPENFISTSTTGSWQTLTGYAIAIAGGPSYLFVRSSLAVSEFYVDSISIKEVANPWTVVNSDSTHYVEFPGVGARFISDTLTPLVELSQTSVITSTKPYVVTCNVNYTAGSGDLKCNVGGVAPTAFTEGFNTKAVTSGAGTVFSFIGDALNVDATITDVFVYRVGMNWIASGSEVIFNNGYTELIIDAVNSNVGIISSGVFQSGVDYKVEVTMKATASFDAEILESNGAVLVSTIGNPSLTTEYQDFTYEFTGTGAYDLFIHRDFTAASSNQTIYIKSVSVRKLGDPTIKITALF